MKLEIIQKDDKFYVKGYFLDFIPFYYDRCCDFTLFRSEYTEQTQDEAERMFAVLEEKYKKEKQFKEAKPKVIKESKI